MSAEQVVLANLGARINAEHAAALLHAGSAMEHAINTGELLAQAKSACPHGAWLPWLRENVSFSDRTAQGYMRLAARRDIRSNVADMSIRKALGYIATPRNHSLNDDLTAWMASAATLKPGAEWTIEDAVAAARRVRAFDEIMHKYGICLGTDDYCLVCNGFTPVERETQKAAP